MVNNGDADLTFVGLSSPTLTALGCWLPEGEITVLPKHEVTQYVLCTRIFNCASNLPFTARVTVTGVVYPAGACSTDLSGATITVSNSCDTAVECTAPGACRVTGGGRQDHTWPAVNFMTHGGQVGAPVGSAGFDPDSPCIHGNWEVVRHGNQGNKGNFHAKSFDSLLCACLACPQDPGSGFVIGGLCNPGARTCGPEPRKAPANKICFSGVGDFAESTGGRAARSVLFRVDVEDRSEPGNSHAGGGTAPADRHRIRIWILTDAEKVRLDNPSDRLLDFRRAIACTPGTTAL